MKTFYIIYNICICIYICIGTSIECQTNIDNVCINEKNEFVLKELRRIIKDDKCEFYPKSAEEKCNLIFVTAYIGTKYSSIATRKN